MFIFADTNIAKATIIKVIVDLYSKLNQYTFEETVKHVALLSPTGRASKKMSEATTYPASSRYYTASPDYINTAFGSRMVLY